MNDIMLVIRTFLEFCWSLITTTTIPGTEFTVAQLMFALAFFGIGLRVLTAMIGVHFPMIPNTNDRPSRIISRTYGSRGSKNVKISPQRRGDDR